MFTLPTAVSAPCPDVEVVFARGTTEPPGVGGVGQASVDSLRAQAGGRSMGVYAVNYPASDDFTNSSVAGARDASAHIQSTAANCPSTKLVLGGFSQDAAVIDMATTDLPPRVAERIAAAADFGGPRTAFADSLSPGPLPADSESIAHPNIWLYRHSTRLGSVEGRTVTRSDISTPLSTAADTSIRSHRPIHQELLQWRSGH